MSYRVRLDFSGTLKNGGVLYKAGDPIEWSEAVAAYVEKAPAPKAKAKPKTKRKPKAKG